MNTGQTMITIGAMLLLAATVLRVTQGFNNTSTIMIDSKLRILAVSEATSIIEEATSKSFDQNTDTTSVGTTSLLTGVNNLGLDGTETSLDHKSFNDFDDYKCYKTTPLLDSVRIFSDKPKLEFRVFCDVYYINPSNPSIKSSVPTWHKKMDIKVTSPALVRSTSPTIVYDTIKTSTIFSYWYFR